MERKVTVTPASEIRMSAAPAVEPEPVCSRAKRGSHTKRLALPTEHGPLCFRCWREETGGTFREWVTD